MRVLENIEHYKIKKYCLTDGLQDYFSKWAVLKQRQLNIILNTINYTKIIFKNNSQPNYTILCPSSGQ